MVQARWPKGVSCPTCGARDPRFIATRHLWECTTPHPRRQFSAKVGTLFEDSALPLATWLPTVWLMAHATPAISSHALARALGVTQKTAWFMLHRLRLAMRTGTFTQLRGPGAAEATFRGGAARFRPKGRRDARRPGQPGRSAGPVAVRGLRFRSLLNTLVAVPVAEIHEKRREHERKRNRRRTS